jgi:Flp pilus assembly protein TadG
MEFGILFWNYNTIANAAREGARAGIIPGTTNADIEAVALNSAIGLRAELLAVDSEPVITSTTMGGTVTVVVTYTTTLITGPMIGAVGGNGAITLNARATMNRE